MYNVYIVYLWIGKEGCALNICEQLLGCITFKGYRTNSILRQKSNLRQDSYWRQNSNMRQNPNL